MLENQIISVATYLLIASVVLFFEVIYPYGILGFLAMCFYGLAIFKAWIAFGWLGTVIALFVALVLGFVTAYCELKMLPNTKRGRRLSSLTGDGKNPETKE